MARNRRTFRKKVGKLERELQGLVDNPPTNPKLAAHRFQLVKQLARLKGKRVQDIKREFGLR